MVLKDFVRDRWLVVLFLLVLFLRLFALNDAWVERCYSLGLYPFLSNGLRAFFGWVPFSVGDVLYLFTIVWFLLKVWKLFVLLRKKKARSHFSGAVLRKYIKLILLIYLVFSLFWGLNYYRQGISAQLGLNVQRYSVQDLFDVTLVLQQRLNSYAEKIDSVQRLQYNQKTFLFQKGREAYQQAQGEYSFLAYHNPSIKASLFTPVGQFVGFTGYYNPFTAEAQLKSDIPVFIKPFVIAHEMGHQLGYAKENEASFVAYLTCKSSTDINFLYSAYFELYRDAFIECKQTPNKELTETLRQNIHPRVRNDARELQLYLLHNQNFIEPFMTGIYDRYLKLNNQPKGKATYDEVIAYLIAYAKKFGKNAI